MVKNNKRGKYKQKWSENDTVLTYFCEKWGPTNLVNASSEDDALLTIANSYIGSSDTSLKQQMLNFRFIISNGSDGYSCFSKIQKKVFDKYSYVGKNDFRNECLTIMSEINTEKVYNEYIKKQLENDEITAYLNIKKIVDKIILTLNEIRKK